MALCEIYTMWILLGKTNMQGVVLIWRYDLELRREEGAPHLIEAFVIFLGMSFGRTQRISQKEELWL